MNKILKLLAGLRPNIDFLTLIQKIFHFFHYIILYLPYIEENLTL